MDTVDRLDLAAAGFKEQASWLAELAERLEELEGPLREEIDDSLDRLHDLYPDAQEAYLVSQAWGMEVNMYEDEGTIGPAVARREREEAHDVARMYREGRQYLDDAAERLDEAGIDVWERVDPDTRLYDPDEYVADMEFDLELGVPFRLLDVADTIYGRVEDIYGRLT